MNIMSHDTTQVTPGHERPHDVSLLKKLCLILSAFFIVGIVLYALIARDTYLTGYWTGF